MDTTNCHIEFFYTPALAPASIAPICLPLMLQLRRVQVSFIPLEVFARTVLALAPFALSLFCLLHFLAVNVTAGHSASFINFIVGHC